MLHSIKTFCFFILSNFIYFNVVWYGIVFYAMVVLKTYFRARPINHRKKDRIIGHFMVCYTALLIYRLMKVKARQHNYHFTTGEIIENLKNMKVLRKKIKKILQQSFPYNIFQTRKKAENPYISRVSTFTLFNKCRKRDLNWKYSIYFEEFSKNLFVYSDKIMYFLYYSEISFIILKIYFFFHSLFLYFTYKKKYSNFSQCLNTSLIFSQQL